MERSLVHLGALSTSHPSFIRDAIGGSIVTPSTEAASAISVFTGTSLIILEEVSYGEARWILARAGMLQRTPLRRTISYAKSGSRSRANDYVRILAKENGKLTRARTRENFREILMTKCPTMTAFDRL